MVDLKHPIKFQRVSRLGFVTAPTSLNGGQSRCLAVSWAGTLYIHFRRLLPPNWILLGAKFTLYPSLAFSYIGSVTARHSSSGRSPNFAAFSRGRHLYSAGRPSRLASFHILVVFNLCYGILWSGWIFAFVVLGLVSWVLAKILAGKNVSEMTYFVWSGR